MINHLLPGWVSSRISTMASFTSGSRAFPPTRTQVRLRSGLELRGWLERFPASSFKRLNQLRYIHGSCLEDDLQIVGENDILSISYIFLDKTGWFSSAKVGFEKGHHVSGAFEDQLVIPQCWWSNLMACLTRLSQVLKQYTKIYSSVYLSVIHIQVLLGDSWGYFPCTRRVGLPNSGASSFGPFASLARGKRWRNTFFSRESRMWIVSKSLICCFPIWKFPKIGVTPPMIHFYGIFHDKPSILGYHCPGGSPGKSPLRLSRRRQNSTRVDGLPARKMGLDDLCQGWWPWIYA